MMEERLSKLDNEIKNTKTAMPIAGSLVDTYFYSKTDTAIYPDNTTVSFKVIFTPIDSSAGIGLTNMYSYSELLANDSYWAQFNPVFLDIDEGGYVNSSGEYVYEGRFGASGYGDTYTLRITAAVYSTVPGSIRIEFS